jgi:hypothetical protein
MAMSRAVRHVQLMAYVALRELLVGSWSTVPR